MLNCGNPGCVAKVKRCSFIYNGTPIERGAAATNGDVLYLYPQEVSRGQTLKDGTTTVTRASYKIVLSWVPQWLWAALTWLYDLCCGEDITLCFKPTGH